MQGCWVGFEGINFTIQLPRFEAALQGRCRSVRGCCVFFLQNSHDLELGRAGQTPPDAARISLEQGTGTGPGSETRGRPAKLRALRIGSKDARHEVFLTNYSFLAVLSRERSTSSSVRTSLTSTPASGPAVPTRPGGCRGRNRGRVSLRFAWPGLESADHHLGSVSRSPHAAQNQRFHPQIKAAVPAANQTRDAVPVIAPASNLLSRMVGHRPPPNYDSVPFQLPLQGRAEEKRRRAELRGVSVVRGTDFRMGPAALQALSDR